MPILCEEYKPEQYDKYDITPVFDVKSLKKLYVEQIDRYDGDTMRALCWGIKFLPTANRHYEKIAYWDKKEASEYIMKQRKKLQKEIDHQ